MQFFLIEKHQLTVATPEELVKEACCHETFCLKKLLAVSQMKKARENFCWDYPKYESQRQFVFNWFDDYQPTGGVFSYYISDIKVPYLLVYKSTFYDQKISPQNRPRLIYESCTKT